MMLTSVLSTSCVRVRSLEIVLLCPVVLLATVLRRHCVVVLFFVVLLLLRSRCLLLSMVVVFMHELGLLRVVKSAGFAATTFVVIAKVCARVVAVLLIL